jgi:hypothetical protein
MLTDTGPFSRAIPKSLVLIIMALWCTSCTTTNTTLPARAATEQLLLSTAADRALKAANLSILANQKVFLDATYFDSYDSKYAIGTIRDALSRAGARLVDTVTNSDIIVEARSGALSIDSSETLFGIPSVGVPVPLAGTTLIPEIAFYKADRQLSTAKIALLAYSNRSRAHIYSSGSLDGKSYDKNYRALFISWVSTDVPELKKHKKNAEKCESWFPQYDRSNVPSISVPQGNESSPTGH